jgi:hypothetical protein
MRAAGGPSPFRAARLKIVLASADGGDDIQISPSRLMGEEIRDAQE